MFLAYIFLSFKRCVFLRATVDHACHRSQLNRWSFSKNRKFSERRVAPLWKYKINKVRSVPLSLRLTSVTCVKTCASLETVKSRYLWRVSKISDAAHKLSAKLKPLHWESLSFLFFFLTPSTKRKKKRKKPSEALKLLQVRFIVVIHDFICILIFTY